MPLRQLPLNYASVSQRLVHSCSGSCSLRWERLKWIFSPYLCVSVSQHPTLPSRPHLASEIHLSPDPPGSVPSYVFNFFSFKCCAQKYPTRVLQCLYLRSTVSKRTLFRKMPHVQTWLEYYKHHDVSKETRRMWMFKGGREGT